MSLCNVQLLYTASRLLQFCSSCHACGQSAIHSSSNLSFNELGSSCKLSFEVHCSDSLLCMDFQSLKFSTTSYMSLTKPVHSAAPPCGPSHVCSREEMVVQASMHSLLGFCRDTKCLVGVVSGPQSLALVTRQQQPAQVEGQHCLLIPSRQPHISSSSRRSPKTKSGKAGGTEGMYHKVLCVHAFA